MRRACCPIRSLSTGIIGSRFARDARSRCISSRCGSKIAARWLSGSFNTRPDGATSRMYSPHGESYYRTGEYKELVADAKARKQAGKAANLGDGRPQGSGAKGARDGGEKAESSRLYHQEHRPDFKYGDDKIQESVLQGEVSLSAAADRLQKQGMTKRLNRTKVTESPELRPFKVAGMALEKFRNAVERATTKLDQALDPVVREKATSHHLRTQISHLSRVSAAASTLAD